MKWIRERDALIAQTMAFVQSVTGRKEELWSTSISSAPPAPAQTASHPAAEEMAETAPLPQNVEQPQPFEVSPPRIVGDFRSEVLSRVANFRKHQERFEREREEYCAETLAKLRASIRDTMPRQPSGK
jgi:hypothetical protein